MIKTKHYTVTDIEALKQFNPRAVIIKQTVDNGLVLRLLRDFDHVAGVIRNGELETPVVKENLTTEFDAVAFQNILDDIASVPTLEGLQYKYDHAVAEFHEAPADKYRQIVAARDKREIELQNIAASEAVIEAKQEAPAFFGKGKEAKE